MNRAFIAKAGPGTDGLTAILDRKLGWLVETCAGILVDVGTLVLLAGVTSRFVFRAPLTWSDELASLLFLWLAMLGAVVAYRRMEHMRMGALVDRRARLKPLADLVGLAAGLSFLALIASPALEYALDEAAVSTPALEISNIWRAAALPVGIALMLVFGALRLIRFADLVALAGAMAVLIAVAGGLFLAKPLIAAMGNYKLIVFFVLLVGAAVLSGIPIAFAFGLGTFSYLALMTRTPLTAPQRSDGSIRPRASGP